MLRKSETGGAAIRRWRAGRPEFRRDVVPAGGGTFAEELALFERQVHDEARRRVGRPAGRAPSDPPAASAA